jgi:antitoxin ChpS
MSHTVVLRKVGGSIMLALPPALLDIVELAAGQQVELSVERGKILIEPRRRPRYTLAELLARCDRRGRPSAEEQEWVEGPPAGAELL